MKKLWGRILFLSALIVMMLSVHAFADNTIQYCASTFTFKSRGSQSSSSFTVDARTNITVHVKIYNNSSNLTPYTQTINNNTNLVLRNTATGEVFYLTDKNYNALEYDVHMTLLKAGTYTFVVENNQDYWFQMYFRVIGVPPIDVPDTLELTVGQSQKVSVAQFNLNSGYMWVEKWDVSANSENPNAATVTNIDNSKTPSVITVYGREVGITLINIYGADGSVDQMKVTVTARETVPTLRFDRLTLSQGEIVYNDVLNSGASVTWSTADPSVARVLNVSNSGKITAVSYGSTKVTAQTVKGGVTYKLVCTVTVQRTEPEFIDFIISVNSLNKKKGRVKITITNISDTNITVYSSGAKLLAYNLPPYPDYQIVRSLKMANASVVTIPKGKSKKLTFNIKGAKLTTGNKYNYAVRVKMAIDGRTYFARGVVDEEMGQYILKSNLATNNWLFSYVRESN